MIQTVLAKCLENLNAENPDLSYIRGMIEVLLAIQEKPITVSDVAIKTSTGFAQPMPNPEQPKDEGAILDATARASLAQVKSIAEKSTE